jgi:hypothetical protein
MKSKNIFKFEYEDVASYYYVTNNEPIKDGEYGLVVNLFNQKFLRHQVVFKMNSEQRSAMESMGGQEKSKVLKVILTNDSELIKDGVEPISFIQIKKIIEYNLEYLEISSLGSLSCQCINYESNCFTGNCRKCGLSKIQTKYEFNKEQFKEALIEASKWESQLSDYERNEISYKNARELVVERIFDKYKDKL